MTRRAKPQLALPLAGGTIKPARGKMPDALHAAIVSLRKRGHAVFWSGGDRHLIDGERVSAADLINRAAAPPKATTPATAAPQLPERAPPAPRTPDDDLLDIPAFLRRPLAS